MAELEVVPVLPEPWEEIAAREDVVLQDGMLHLLNRSIAPHEATRADLLLLRDALDEAGVPVILARTASDRPVLAIDLAYHAAAAAAIRSAARAEPLYARVPGRRPALVAASGLPLEAEVGAATLYRPRLEPRGGLRYGHGQGVRVEFWRMGEELIETPSRNALTRRRIARDDLRLVPVERHGRSWTTLAGMFARHPGEFAGDIDMVFSWVDGSSSEFQRERAKRMQGYIVGEGDDQPARFRHVDELRYALRSVHLFAPWVRRIFIATDSERPAWLAEHPKVTLVRSAEFFADTSVLPTHNSHAVESQLHRIEGLAEHFLYSNDDMFFGRPVRPELFFSPGGVSRFVESAVRIGTGEPAPHRSGHDNAARVNRRLIEERFGMHITRDLAHCAAPLRRSVMAELEREFPEEFARTAAARFRSATDVSVTNSLYHYYALMTGAAVRTNEPSVRYIQTTRRKALRQMERLVAQRRHDMFCLNDGSTPELPERQRVQAVRDCLERYFPVPAPWERIAGAVGTDAARGAGEDGPVSEDWLSGAAAEALSADEPAR